MELSALVIKSREWLYFGVYKTSVLHPEPTTLRIIATRKIHKVLERCASKGDGPCWYKRRRLDVGDIGLGAMMP